MSQRTSLPIALLLALGSGSLWAATAPAPEKIQPAIPAPPTLDERVSNLEQTMKSQSLLDMLSRIDQLQQENRDLQGQLEEQRHLIDEMKQQQSDLYRDIDRRLSDLERLGTSPQSASTQPGNGAATAELAPPTQAERDAYQQAFEQLRGLRYEQAIDGFRAFLKSYPDGRYAPSAQYWLAEAYYARHDYPNAITEYQTLRSRFPSNTKTPEALLKIGYCYSVLGKKDEARAAFAELMKSYPQSPEAQQADTGLQRLSGEAAEGR